jgi:hypothetical protein
MFQRTGKGGDGSYIKKKMGGRRGEVEWMKGKKLEILRATLYGISTSPQIAVTTQTHTMYSAIM